LERNASEVRNMLFGWDWDEAKEVWQEEAREDGVAIGREEGETRVLDLMAKGYGLEQIKDILNSGK